MSLRFPASAALRLQRLAAWAGALGGWRRTALALSLGALSALALPPIDFVPAFAVAIPGLIWLIDGSRSGRSAFAAGWLFGFGHHFVGLYWIANAFLVDAGNFAWLIPFVCSGLPALFAFLIGAVAWVSYRFSDPGWCRVLLFAAAWGAAEWVRAYLFTGFPWNLVGYIWAGSGPMLQLTALVGIYGLGLLTVLAAAAPAALASAGPAGHRLLLIAWSVLLLVGLGGALRLQSDAGGTVDGVRLRLVQANIPQRMKWRAEERLAIFRQHLELSARPAAESPTVIIWPETAVPFFLADEPVGLKAIADMLPPSTILLTGAPRSSHGPDGSRQVWNSLLAVGEDGRVIESYDKSHLVPLGEYVPFRGWLNLAKVTPGTVDFSPGPGPRTLSLPGVPTFSPLICYEVIFPGAVIGSERPAWLLNVTNDGWYGVSTGPYQHLQIARVRAIEEGVPLVRAANTGISAVVDAYGRITARLGLQETGVIDSPLPVALANPTPYARFGNATFALLLLVVAAIPLSRAGKLRRSQLNDSASNMRTRLKSGLGCKGLDGIQ